MASIGLSDSCSVGQNSLLACSHCQLPCFYKLTSRPDPADRHGWAKARKGVLLDIAKTHLGVPVPVIFFTRIFEPIYIAFARSTRPGALQMQFNLFDNNG